MPKNRFFPRLRRKNRSSASNRRSSDESPLMRAVITVSTPASCGSFSAATRAGGETLISLEKTKSAVQYEASSNGIIRKNAKYPAASADSRFKAANTAARKTRYPTLPPSGGASSSLSGISPLFSDSESTRDIASRSDTPCTPA